MKYKYIISFLLLAVVLQSCDKNKRASKRLMDPGRWVLTDIQVAGEKFDNHIEWEVAPCEIYEESCEAHWLFDGNSSRIYWQFNDKAETFTISRAFESTDTSEYYTTEAKVQAYRFSGEYQVLTRKRKQMRFQSTQTEGYSGETVVIEIRR